MDSHIVLSNVPKPSFAKIAAMAASTEQKKTLVDRQHPALNHTQSVLATGTSLVRVPGQHIPATREKSGVTGSTGAYQAEAKDLHGLDEAVRKLRVCDNDHTSGKESPMGSHHPNGTVKVEGGVEDDHTQFSNSSTKPASLDGKSVASGATFALDEKESLRPDDSASVKAAEEEEGSFSGPASGAPSSRVGSEAGSRAFRDQFSEISERIGPSLHRGPAVNRFGVPGIQEEEPPGTAPPINPIVAAPSVPGDEAFSGMATSYGFSLQAPDEKLLEALESPKDRLFLLKLEQDVISFVRDSKLPILDLPPCNSFCRLLAHKLADYYYLTHFVDNAVSAVRLYRTPFCRLPPPLTSRSNPPTTGSTPPPNAPAVKIMRRAGLGGAKQTTLDGNTTASSTNASKDTSDVGGESGSDEGRNHVHSPAESMTAKDKSAMTREEREAKYKEARERIFKGFEESDNVETNSGPEELKELSRSSSTNGKRKTKQQRNAQDDGFEARSQFNAYYPTMQYVNPSFATTGLDTSYYNPYGVPSANLGRQTTYLNNRSGQEHNPTYQQLSSFAPHPQPGYQQPLAAGVGSAYNQGFDQPLPMVYDQMLHNQYNPALQQPSVASQRSSTVASPVISNFAQPVQLQPQPTHPQWPQSYYQSPYQGQATQPQSPASQRQQQQIISHLPSSVPYPYGQLPSQPGRQNYQNQHPLPGSFNRQSFNPKTQSFIPGNGFMAHPTAPYGPHLYPMNTSARGQGSLTNQAPLNMQRQGIHYPCSTSFTGPQPAHTNGGKPFTTQAGTAPTSQVQPFNHSSLSKWGTPSHLPPKPPPPQMPNFMDNQLPLPPHVYPIASSQSNAQNTHGVHHGLSPNGGANNFSTPSTSIKLT